MIQTHRKKGFTIVELVVVIAVIGILAALGLVGWRNWQEGIGKKQLESDLKQASTAMENAKNFGSGYPTSLPATFKPGQGVTLSYMSGDDKTYCLEAYKTSSPSVKYRITQADSKAAVGSCAGTSIATPVITEVAVSGYFFNIFWNSVTNAASYDVETRPNSSGTWATYATISYPALEEYIEFDSPNTAQFRIRASSSSGTKSAWSETITITRLGAPSDITYCTHRYGFVNHSWTSPAGANNEISKFVFTWQYQSASEQTLTVGNEINGGYGSYEASLSEPEQGATIQSYYGVSADGRTATLPKSPVSVTGSDYIGSCDPNY